MDAINFGPSAKNKMATIELFLRYVLWTSLVNAIALESFHQSISNLIYDVIHPKGRTLLISDFLLKSRWPPSTYVLLKVIYACECDIFTTVSPINFKLEICSHII